MTVFATLIKWSLLWTDRGPLLHGLLVAVEITATALALSVFVGLLLAVMRMARPPLTWVAAVYINIFRGVPVIVTALWVFFALSEATGINFSVYEAGVVSLTLLYSAFISEIYRAALEAIPRGQREAGLALGMGRLRIFVSVVLPQATKIAVPNIGSMMIGMIKDTSVLFIIGTMDVVGVVQSQAAVNYQYFTLYTAAALLYVAVAFLVDFGFRAIEKTMQTPPRGLLARAATSRRRRRVEAIKTRFEVGLATEGTRAVLSPNAEGS
jgi:His/Glu/Gln/Arg/opine family amino acid ABC transporter permease subunit